MRVVIAIENIPYPDGRLIKPQAIEVKRDFIPVTFLGDQLEIIGKASAIEREDDGVKHIVSMEIELAEKYRDKVDLEAVDAYVGLSPVEFSGDDRNVVERGELREVSIALFGGWPRVNGQKWRQEAPTAAPKILESNKEAFEAEMYDPELRIKKKVSESETLRKQSLWDD